MSSSQLGPFLATLVLQLVSTLAGIGPVKKMIQVREARHELKQGSAGAIRSIGGWSIIAVWLALTWHVATILGDWMAGGDLAGAVDRSWVRLRIILEILAALGESDN